MLLSASVEKDIAYVLAQFMSTPNAEHGFDDCQCRFPFGHSFRAIYIFCTCKIYEEHASGDGQYDAFMNALKAVYRKLEKPIPKLIDYVVTIPPGGRTDALVETVITWESEKEFKTRGLDPDQTVAAIKATMKMINILEHEQELNKVII